MPGLRDCRPGPADRWPRGRCSARWWLPARDRPCAEWMRRSERVVVGDVDGMGLSSRRWCLWTRIEERAASEPPCPARASLPGRVITTRPTQVLGVSQLAPRNTKLKGTGRTEHALVVDDVIGFPCGEAEDTDDLVWCRWFRSDSTSTPALRSECSGRPGPRAFHTSTTKWRGASTATRCAAL